MGLLSFLKRKDEGFTIDELARRLGIASVELQTIKPSYQQFQIPKRGVGTRTISAPDAKLKSLQRRILHRLLALLVAHPSAIGFEKGRSIVHNAQPHVGKAVVVRMDLERF